MRKYRNRTPAKVSISAEALELHRARITLAGLADWIDHYRTMRGHPKNPPPAAETVRSAIDLLIEHFPRKVEWLAELARREEAERHAQDDRDEDRRRRRALAARIRRRSAKSDGVHASRANA